MKISYKYEQIRRNTLRFSLRNGADSSVSLVIGGLLIPQIAERDFASLDVCEGNEELVRGARKAIVDLVASRWALGQISWGRNVVISTASGTLRGSTSSTQDVKVDEETGDVVIEGFRPEMYEGAFNAMGQGTGYSLPGWTDSATELDAEVQSVESTLGTFTSLAEYVAAREKAGLSQPVEPATA